MFYDQKRYVFLLNFTLDVICLIVLFFILIPFANRIFNNFSLGSIPHILFQEGISINIEQIIISSVIIVFSILVKFLFHGYRNDDAQSKKNIFYQSFIPCLAVACIAFIFIVVLTTDLKKAAVFSGSIGFILWVVFAANRFYFYFFIKNGDRNQNIIKHILIAGTGQKSKKIGNYILSHPSTGLRLAGFLTNRKDEIGQQIFSHTIIGEVKNLYGNIHAHYVDCVFYTGEKGYDRDVERLIDACATMGIDFASTEIDLQSELLNQADRFTEQINKIIIVIWKFVYRPPELVFLKRVIDLIASVVLIFFSLPIFLVIALAVKTTSPGPVFYRQERIGKYGRKFVIYKFRSMVLGAEKMQEKLIHLNEMDGPVFKIKYDPRQTKTGDFLRKTGLDELPQLFNVFKGDISLVGPRPAIETEVIQYRPWERKRLSVTQGITCIWQVNGRYEVTFNEWMKLDILYIKNWSLAVDLKIITKTVYTILSLIQKAYKKE